MANYLRTLNYMIEQGMKRDKALLAVYTAFALSPEQVTVLAAKIGVRMHGGK